eukprot:1347456-Amorphochlora_amoeboformis.AAC.1
MQYKREEDGERGRGRDKRGRIKTERERDVKEKKRRRDRVMEGWRDGEMERGDGDEGGESARII